MEITREFAESGPASMTDLAQFSERCESPAVRSETGTRTLGYALCRGLENAEFNTDFDTE